MHVGQRPLSRQVLSSDHHVLAIEKGMAGRKVLHIHMCHLPKSALPVCKAALMSIVLAEAACSSRSTIQHVRTAILAEQRSVCMSPMSHRISHRVMNEGSFMRFGPSCLPLKEGLPRIMVQKRAADIDDAALKCRQRTLRFCST